MDEFVIQSHRGPYRVAFSDTPFEGIRSGLSQDQHLIVDDQVADIYHDELEKPLGGHSVLRITADEPSKSLEQFPAYVTHLLDCGVRRNHVLIAVGGGVIQDITAFLAATLLRGIPWQFYPTTLLAQADSCIGSKSSVNVGPYKNQLGTFTPPKEISISPVVLETLAAADIRSGIGEMLKVHVIAGWDDIRSIAVAYSRLSNDPELLLRYLKRSLEIKVGKIEADEFDRRERLVMNYGHSFGHAIESATEYRIPHGIAVTVGMDLANYVSWRLNHATRDVFEELHRILAQNYQGFVEIEIPEDAFFEALGRDKKNQGADLSLILIREPGDLSLERYPMNDNLRGICTDYLKSLKSFQFQS